MNYTQPVRWARPDTRGKITVTDQQLLEKLDQWLVDAERSTAYTKWVDESKEDYAFYAGKQDDQDVIDILEAQNRPTTTFNEIKPKVDMMVGLADQIRRVPTVLPVGSEDQALAELMNGVYKHYRYTLGITDREMDCFEHTLKSGLSWMHFYVDNQNPFDPQIKCVRIPGRDVVLDPDCLQYDLSDARYIFTSKWFTEEDVMAIWPDIDFEGLRMMAQSHDSDRPTYFDEANEKLRVVECWYRKKESVIWFQNPITGQPDFLRWEQWPKFKEALRNGIQLPQGTVQMDEPPPAVQTYKDFIYFAIFSNNVLLESGPSPYRHNYFPYVLYGAYKNEDENRWFGPVTVMKDPQRGINTMRRQLAHLLQTSPKGILMHEADSLVNEDDYEKDSSSPNFRLIVSKGHIDRVKFSDQPNISPVYSQLDEVYVQSMKDVSGSQDPLMGIQTSSREPGITARMRLESSIAVLYLLFGNFRRSRIQGGKIMLSMIQQYVQMPKVIRIEGPKGLELVNINTQINPQNAGFNDISAGQYDLVIDETEENVTMRRGVAQMLLDLAQNNPDTIPPEIILEYLDLPFSVKEQVREYNEARIAREQALQEAEIQAKLQKPAPAKK